VPAHTPRQAAHCRCAGRRDRLGEAARSGKPFATAAAAVFPAITLPGMGRPMVFITGAAAGIGRATALYFAGRDYLVGAYDIDELGLSRLAAEITGAGGQVHTGVLDVTNTTQWSER